MSKTKLLQLQFGVCACVLYALCVHACIVHPSRFVLAIIGTFMHGFQNNLAQLFCLRSKSAI